MNKDELYMHRCIKLAKLAAGNVAPNPMVGAILVYKEKLIGEGYHKKFGAPHAEVNCMNSVKEIDRYLIEKSTLYVSLEPCSHFGKTPPCSDLIINNKIPKVVIGCLDIFKEVNGRGIEKLKNAGIEVVTDVLENECLELNKRFFTFHQKLRPYIILKWAESADGKIAASPNPSAQEERVQRTFISNDYSNRLVHKWRSEEAAILIGTHTALLDDPSLTTRLWKGNDPLRLVIDMNLQLPSHLKIFNKDVKTIIFNKIKNEQNGNLIYHKIDEENILPEILNVLHILQIHSVLVEGGAKLLQSFIDAGLWDETRIIKNEELLIINGVKAPQLKDYSLVKKEHFFKDTISYFHFFK